VANTYNRVNIAGGSGGGDAIDIFYDNTGSGLAASDVQAAIDELAASTGASYIGTFNVGSWVLNSGLYKLTILASTHGRGTNPVLQIYQENGLNFDEVLTGVEMSAIGDITITIASSPDLRFSGKIIIK